MELLTGQHRSVPLLSIASRLRRQLRIVVSFFPCIASWFKLSCCSSKAKWFDVFFWRKHNVPRTLGAVTEGGRNRQEKRKQTDDFIKKLYFSKVGCFYCG